MFQLGKSNLNPRYVRSQYILLIHQDIQTKEKFKDISIFYDTARGLDCAVLPSNPIID